MSVKTATWLVLCAMRESTVRSCSCEVQQANAQQAEAWLDVC